MIDISIIIALVTGFATIAGMCYKLLEKAGKNASDIKEMRAELRGEIAELKALLEKEVAELRTEVELEFALCRVHDKCHGVMLSGKVASDNENDRT